MPPAWAWLCLTAGCDGEFPAVSPTQRVQEPLRLGSVSIPALTTARTVKVGSPLGHRVPLAVSAEAELLPWLRGWVSVPPYTCPPRWLEYCRDKPRASE